MLAKQIGTIISFIVILSFTGCNRIVDMGKRTFNQGCVSKEFNKIPREYVRTTRVYQELEVRGIFSAMWLSKEVRASYCNLYGQKEALSDKQMKEMLKKQLADDKDYISFYIMAFAPGVDNRPLNAYPYRENGWNVFLKIGDVTLKPSTLTCANLSAEYIDFFGRDWSQFKTGYFVRFPSHFKNKPLIDECTESIVLCFTSLKRKTCLIWDLKDCQLIEKEMSKADCIHSKGRRECMICKDIVAN